MKYFFIFSSLFCLQLAPSAGTQSFIGVQVTKVNCDLQVCILTLKSDHQKLSIAIKSKDLSFKVGETLWVNNLKFMNHSTGVLAALNLRLPNSKMVFPLIAVSKQKIQAKSFLRQHHPSSDYLLF